jgi:hypothetical protein
MTLAEGKFGDQIEVAWRDFNMTDRTDSSDPYPGEEQISTSAIARLRRAGSARTAD